jgi:hypothetical protein
VRAASMLVARYGLLVVLGLRTVIALVGADQMNMQEVDSSSIAAIGYETTSRTLEIAFKNGRIYRYFDVPTWLNEAFVACGSKGRFFNENVRDLYRCVRMR